MKDKLSPEAIAQMKRDIVGKPLTIEWGGEEGPQILGKVETAEISPDGHRIDLVVDRTGHLPPLPPELDGMIDPRVSITISFT